MRLIATATLVTGSNPRVVLAALILAIASGASGTFASSFECARIVALGDLHGGIDSLQTMLEGTGITDSHHQWTSSDACLVIVGDMVDRGDRSRELLDYLMSLERQAPEQVHVVLGNHEVMNLVGDLRYVTPGEFAAYADLETKKQRRAGYKIFLRTRAAQELSGSRRKEEIYHTLQGLRSITGYVATVEDLLNSKQLADREYFQPIGHPAIGEAMYPAAVFRMEGETWRNGRAPLLG